MGSWVKRVKNVHGGKGMEPSQVLGVRAWNVPQNRPRPQQQA